MRILYILKHNPWGIGGGCYACRNYLEAFGEVFKEAQLDVLICEEYRPEGNSVDVSHSMDCDTWRTADFPNCTFYSVKARSKVSLYLTPFTGVMHRHQEVAKKVLRKHQYDYCMFDHNSIAGTLVEACKQVRVKSIVLNHNCEVEYFRDNNSVLRKMLLLPWVRRNERRSYLRCDYNIFLTEEDKVLFREMYGESKTVSIVSGCFNGKGMVDVNSYNHHCSVKRDASLARNQTIVISGTIGNVQNLDGINYFLDELYNVVPKDVKVVITGKNAPESLVERVKMLDNVDIVPDPVDIDAVVRRCDIFLCTTRLGGGMKLRVMDGFRNGLPVITHAVSARGYGEFIRRGVCWKFDTKEQFADALNIVIAKINNNELDNIRIIDAYNELMSFDKTVERLRFMVCES